jgi:hypothetical protein
MANAFAILGSMTLTTVSYYYYYYYARVADGGRMRL